MQNLAQSALLICMLFAAVQGAAWADGRVARDGTAKSSPLPSIKFDGWGEEETEDDSWTWFGMGYETRIPSSGLAATSGFRRIEKKK